jgi:TonB-dependent receptor
VVTPFRAPAASAILSLGLLIGGIAPDPVHAQAAGALRGTVYDRDFGVPVAGARVSVVEAAQSRTTKEDGSFLFESLPAGAYTVSASKDGYNREVVSSVVVSPGSLAEVRVELSLEVVELEEMVVTGTDLLAGTEIALLEIRADALTVQDAVSAELISKAGVGDAAGALKLVVGASVAEGKYATVRGLSDRYTGTTLNGVRVPSADPRKRAVQMDIVPTGTIESITVTKTFTPDLQGDFSGGGVDIVTKSVPDERIASVSVSGEWNSLATGNDRFLTYIGGGVPWNGFDDGGRALPDAAKSPPADSPAPVSYSRIDNNRPGGTRITDEELARRIAVAEQYDTFTRAFSPVLGVSREAPGLDFGLSGVWGDRWDIARGRFGAVAALTYRGKSDFYDEARNDRFRVQKNFDTGQIESTLEPRTDSRGTDELLIGALASAVWQLDGGSEYALRFVGNQGAEDEGRYQEESLGSRVRQNQSLRYTQRSLASLQFHGKNKWDEVFGNGSRGFSGIQFHWFASANYTRQYEPDVRFFRNLFEEQILTAFFEPGAVPDTLKTRRIFRDIDETSSQFSANLVFPFTQWTDSEGKLKTGLYLEKSDRNYGQNSFYYLFQFSQPSSNTQAQQNNTYINGALSNPGGLWTDFFLSPDRIGISDNRCEPPTTAFQDRSCAQPSQLLWYITPLAEDVDYDGRQTIEAGYAMAELPLVPTVRLIGGARWETTKIRIVPFNEAFGRVSGVVINEFGQRFVDPNVPQEEAIASIDESALLPALGAVWEIRPGMNLRASWARTIARPTYRELAPVATEEFLAGDAFIGNPDLVVSRVQNWDLRWEWFQDAGDVLAVSLFRKSIDDPIELISFSAAGGDYLQPVNYQSGRARGAEIEAKLSLGRFARWLAGLGIGGNYSVIRSEVDIPPEERSRLDSVGLDEETRRLQGQPDNVLNFNVTYDNERTGTSAGVFYNRTGATLVAGASIGETGGIPKILTRPEGTLDVSVTQKWKGVKFTLRGKNLTTPERITAYRLPDDSETVRTQRLSARAISLGVSYAW